MKARQFLAPLALAAALATGASTATAGAPIDQGRQHFVTDPYATNICGVDGTAVDTVVTSWVIFANEGAVNPTNVDTVFTATSSGKTIEWRHAGMTRYSAPVDNGDGTFTQQITVDGTSAVFKLPNGRVLVTDVGSITFAVTFDSDGNFVSFEVVRTVGPRPDGCPAIVDALT